MNWFLKYVPSIFLQTDVCKCDAQEPRRGFSMLANMYTNMLSESSGELSDACEDVCKCAARELLRGFRCLQTCVCACATIFSKWVGAV